MANRRAVTREAPMLSKTTHNGPNTLQMNNSFRLSQRLVSQIVLITSHNPHLPTDRLSAVCEKPANLEGDVDTRLATEREGG